MQNSSNYEHTQRSPLCLLIYAVAVIEGATTWPLRNEPLLSWLFPLVSALLFVLAGSFHFLRVRDEVDQLVVAFGPLPLFRRTLRYDQITHFEPGRTTLLDGWGIHLSLRGGWVWNIWGRDCVVIRLGKRTLRLGTDDVAGLLALLESRTSHQDP